MISSDFQPTGEIPTVDSQVGGAPSCDILCCQRQKSLSKIEYVVNGPIVRTTPKTGLTANRDGIDGIRVNRHLEVPVDDFGVSKQ